MRTFLAAWVLFSMACTPLGELSLEQSRIDFGPAVPGIVWKKRTFVHSEHGEALVLQARSSNPVFEVSFPEGASLPARGSQELEVSYRPTPLIAEREEGTITLSTNVKELSATLEVVGFPTEVDCSVPATIDFGTVSRGDTARLTLQLENASNYRANALVTDASNSFFAVEGAGAISLGAGEVHSVPITFSPSNDGPYSSTIGVRRHQQLCNEQSITLVGTGVVGTFSWAPAILDFGDVPVGTTARLTLTFTNLDFFPLTLGGLAAREGSNPSGIFGAPASLVLPAATRNAAGEIVPGVASIELTFTPTAAGPQAGQLVASVSDSPIQSTMSVNLRGVGVP